MIRAKFFFFFENGNLHYFDRYLLVGVTPSETGVENTAEESRVKRSRDWECCVDGCGKELRLSKTLGETNPIRKLAC